MAEDKRENEEEVTPKGAVEVDEKDLDQAAGGMSSGGDLPTDSVSLNYTKIEFDKASQTTVPQDPSIGLLKEADKKI